MGDGGCTTAFATRAVDRDSASSQAEKKNDTNIGSDAIKLQY
jgi:hypothetical protein